MISKVKVLDVMFKVIWVINYTQYSIAQVLQKLTTSWVKWLWKTADLRFVYRNAWWQNRIERNEMYWKKLISIDVVIWLDDSYAEDLILFLIDWINGEEKKRKFFFSPSLFSFLPFRLDTNEEKEKIYLAHSSTTINKSRKKRRNRREKRAQKISSLTRRISLPQRRREEKIVPTYTHTHTYASFFRFLLPQFN